MEGGGTASVVAAALFGLDGFRLLVAVEAGGKLELLVETMSDLVGCPEYGSVARAKDRRPVGAGPADRPVVLCWHKRVWGCPQALCRTRTWTERHPDVAPHACLTEQARQWASEQVAECDAAVDHVARALGVGWATIMPRNLMSPSSHSSAALYHDSVK